MVTQQIPVSPPWCLFLGKPSESGVWLTGNVVLVAPILLLVRYHPSAETTSCLSHVFTIPVLFHSFTHPLCASGAQGLPRMSWEILLLPRLGYLLLHQNGMETNEEALTLLSASLQDSKITHCLLVSPQGKWPCPCWQCRRNRAAEGQQLLWKLLHSAASANWVKLNMLWSTVPFHSWETAA